MTLLDHIDSLSADERLMLLGRLQGMTLARRIARNRAEDCRQMADSEHATPELRERYLLAAAEAEHTAASIRLVQVGIGNASLPFSDMTPDELDEINRIY